MKLNKINIFAVQFVAVSGTEMAHFSYLMGCITQQQFSVIKCKSGNKERHAADERVFVSRETAGFS